MKRKTLAVLLSVLLVVSAVLVLTACNKEYTITFRNSNNAKMDELQTVKGKVEYTKKNLTADDRVFDGWYDSLTNNADGTQTYGKKVDLATTTFDKDTTLYAKWTLIGESVGYCLPGVINGVTDWDLVTVVETAARKLTHQEGTNVYTMTDLTLKQGDSFKVVSAVPAKTGEWAGQVKIEAGYSQATVKIAEGATLPDDVDGTDTEVLISAGDMNNISILRDMKVDIRFEYSDISEDCVVTVTIKEASGAPKAPISELGFIIVGSISSWNGPFAADGQYKDFIMTPDAAKVIYKATVSFNPGAFKIKVNESDWNRDNYGFAQLMGVTVDDTVILPDGVTKDDIFTDDGGNITTKYKMTAEIELDTENGIITINVTALEELTETHQMYIIGTIGGGNFDQVYGEKAVKLTKGENSTVWSGKITITEDDYGPDWTIAQGGLDAKCAAIKVKNNVDKLDYGIGENGKGNIFLLAGDYYVTYDEKDNSVKFEACAYYIVGTFVDAEDKNVNFTVKDGLTPKLTVSQDGLTATATLTVTDVSEKEGYTWLGEDGVFAVQAVYGTSLGVAQWFGGGNTKIAAAGTYTITLTIESGALSIVAAE